MCDLDRRTFLTVATGAGLGIALAACASPSATEMRPATAGSPPQMGPATAGAPPQAPTDNLPDPGLRKIDPSEFRRPVVLTRGNIIDVTRGAVRERMDVRIAEGKIEAIGVDLPAADAAVVDLSGRYVMPGLISTHCHPGVMLGLRMDPNGQSPERIKHHLAVWLRYGVTTVQSLGTDRPFAFEVQREERSPGTLIGARLLSVGRGFGVPQGLPPFRMDPPGFVRETEPEPIRRALEDSAQKGASGIKIWYDAWYGQFPKMQPQVARTIIAEGARVRLKTYAHVYAVDDAKLLIRSGLHAVAHMPRDREVDSELINLMLARKVSVIPTLAVAESNYIFVDRPSWVDDPLFGKFLPPGSADYLRHEAFLNTYRARKEFPELRPDYERAVRNVGKLHAAGVPFGFGTDTGVGNRVPGFYEHRELELLVSAGVAPIDALRMATVGSAEIVGQKGVLGEIAPGHRADLVVLKANPLQNIRNTRTVESVWLDGVQACGAL
jgi:imidazolonepropionase-like amidohydrolase